MSRKLEVLVTGATGKQGGAVARALKARGHSVHAFTRNPNAAAATALAAAGVHIIRGDLDDAAGLAAAAALVDTVFLMGNSWEAGPEAERTQGLAAVAALAEARVGHVIYASVASADRETGIPHFDSKLAVEQRLAASNLAYTISAPVAFMDNLLAPWSIGALAQGRLAMALPPERKLQQIAVADIGRFVAVLAERREAVFGRRIDIAGDAISGAEMAKSLSRAAGRTFEYVETPLATLREQSPEAAIMFEWFDRVGYDSDIEGLRRDLPDVGWRRFDDWARSIDWSVLDGRQAAE